MHSLSSLLLFALAISSIQARAKGFGKDLSRPANSVPAPAPVFSLTVGNEGNGCPGQYDTIQDAVNAAPAGAVVRLCPGTYFEDVAVDRPVTIQGFPSTVEPTQFNGQLNIFDGGLGSTITDVSFYQDTVEEFHRKKQAMTTEMPLSCSVNVFASGVTISQTSFDFSLCGLAVWANSAGITVKDSNFTAGVLEADDQVAIVLISGADSIPYPESDFLFKRLNILSEIAFLVSPQVNITGITIRENNITINATEEGAVLVISPSFFDEKRQFADASGVATDLRFVENTVTSIGQGAAIGVLIDTPTNKLKIEENLFDLGMDGIFMACEEGSEDLPPSINKTIIRHNTVKAAIGFFSVSNVADLKITNNDVTIYATPSFFFVIPGADFYFYNLAVYHNRFNVTIEEAGQSYGLSTVPISVLGDFRGNDNIIIANINPSAGKGPIVQRVVNRE